MPNSITEAATSDKRCRNEINATETSEAEHDGPTAPGGIPAKSERKYCDQHRQKAVVYHGPV